MRKFSNLERQDEGLKSKLIGGLAALSLMISSCQSISPEEKARLQKEIEELNAQEKQGKDMVNYYDSQMQNLKDSKSKLEKEIEEMKKELGILKSGRAPKYILKLFEVPVDEQFYKESEIGKQLGEGSRSFSFGHSGDIKVIGKRIE